MKIKSFIIISELYQQNIKKYVVFYRTTSQRVSVLTSEYQ